MKQLIKDKKKELLSVLALVSYLILNFFLSNLSLNSLKFLLKPTNAIVSFFTNSKSVFLENEGYFHEKLNIIINETCSGYNFGLIIFVMIVFIIISNISKTKNFIVLFPFALFISYLLTISINSSRIFVSILMQNQANRFLPQRPHLFIHDIVGIAINVFFLIIIYYSTIYLFHIKLKNEKHSKS